MAIRIPTTDQSKIFLGSQEIGAVYVGANKVWPDAPVVTEEMSFTHNKQTSFSITITCSTYSGVILNWGDGTSVTVSSGTARSKTYAAPGTYKVTVTGNLNYVTNITCSNQQLLSVSLHSAAINMLGLTLSSNSSLTGTLTVPATWSKFYGLYADNTSLEKIHILGDGDYYNSISSIRLTPNNYLQEFKANQITKFTYIKIVAAPLFSILELNNVERFQSLEIYNDSALTTLSLPSLTTIELGNGLSAYSTGLANFSAPNLVYISQPFDLSVNTNLAQVTTASGLFVGYNLKLNDSGGNSNSLHQTFLSVGSIKKTSSVYYRNCGLSQSQVDAILAHARTVSLIGSSGRTYLYLNNLVSLGTLNSAPSAAGIADRNWLNQNGWTVSTAT